MTAAAYLVRFATFEEIEEKYENGALKFCFP